MKKIFLVIAVACLLVLGAGCLSNSAEKGPAGSAFSNLENAESYVAKMNQDMELKEPLQASINIKMNMLYEKANGGSRMYTEVEEFNPGVDYYAAYEVMLKDAKVDVKINELSGSAGEKPVESKQETVQNEAEKKGNLYGVKYYEEMILDARKGYEKVDDVEDYQEYETYRVVMDIQELEDYSKNSYIDMAAEENWGDNWEVEVKDAEVRAVIDPDEELIKRMDWGMKETLIVRPENDRQEEYITEVEYGGVIEYSKYNEPLDFPAI